MAEPAIQNVVAPTKVVPVFQRGQKVACRISVDKESNAEDWIVGLVAKFDSKSNKYIVKDILPDPTSTEDSWQVEPKYCIPFPSAEEPLYRGDQVLSLWYMQDIREWSSMFYPAYVIAPTGVPNIYKLRFQGSNNIYNVARERIIKIDKISGKRAAEGPAAVEEPPAKKQAVEPVEESKEVVEEPTPVAEEPKPVASEPKPVAGEPKPVVEEPKPVVEEPKEVAPPPASAPAE